MGMIKGISMMLAYLIAAGTIAAIMILYLFSKEDYDE